MFLSETIKKENDRFYIYSHKTTNKKLGKKNGYGTTTEAVGALLGLTSRGKFYNYPIKKKKAIIKSYKERHNL